MKRRLLWLAAKVASVFYHRPGVFSLNGEQTGQVISKRGSCVIIRDYKSLMFIVIDIESEGGPEIVNEYAIYRNAVIGAECWEYRKRNHANTKHCSNGVREPFA